MDGDNKNSPENVGKIKKKYLTTKKKVTEPTPENEHQDNMQGPINITFLRKPTSETMEEKEKMELNWRVKERKNETGRNAVAANKNKNNGETSKELNNLTVTENPQIKVKSIKKKLKNPSNFTAATLAEEDCSGIFEMEDIMNDSTVLKLIEDLVNCFVSNYSLPENELNTLKMSIFERTCFLFLNILNSCVKKTFNRVLASDLFDELKNKPILKDACCQTSFPISEKQSES